MVNITVIAHKVSCTRVLNMKRVIFYAKRVVEFRSSLALKLLKLI